MYRLLVGLLLLTVVASAQALDAPCVPLERVTAAAFTNYEFWIVPPTPGAATLAQVGCYCQGTCSTAAQFSFSIRTTGATISLDGAGNLACATGSSVTTWRDTDSGDVDRMLAVGEGLRLSVSNSPTSVDRVTVCVRFTY